MEERLINIIPALIYVVIPTYIKCPMASHFICITQAAEKGWKWSPKGLLTREWASYLTQGWQQGFLLEDKGQVLEMWRIGEGSMPAILIMPPSSLKYGHLNINEASTWQ